MKFYLLQASVLALALAVPATGQSQKVSPPKTVYWMSAATQSGFGMGSAPSTSDMMRMAMGGGGSSVIKTLNLDLGSKLPPSPAPGAADHAVPPGMNMGANLPLRAPKKGTPSQGTEEFERPKGKLLLFWGCGETAKPGQPVVFDFARIAAGEMPANLFGGERVRLQRPPNASTWPTYVYWPNTDKQNGSRQVPSNASLVGPHKVTGNFAPQMDFSLQQDWMQGVNMKQQKNASGSVGLQWNVVPGATAHFAQMVAGRDEGGAPVIVFWASSETQTFFSGMSDFISPSEASRLVGKKLLMPPSQTSCAIPKEAVAAAKDAGLILLTSHGPEQNIVYPPRPKDPKVDWVQEWSVKARFVSRTGAIIGMEDMGGAGGATASGKPKCKPDAATEAGKAAGGGIGGSVGRAMGGALGGLMGKKKPKEDCEP
ncbi:hypothetical protein [Sandaracinobacteroides hominis]|uniref:hypothetical protein n=1 Tax=Sandaracinobacteroides hominis TaxID=2780086 RepID=UPI0018F624F1|nr:hypothetical protein [Sandaracinobacteroides hominis]